MIIHHASDINADCLSGVFDVGAVTAVELAPAVALRPSAAAKLGRADGSMKAPSARPAKKARQDAFDPMDPVCSPHLGGLSLKMHCSASACKEEQSSCIQ